MVKAQSLCFQSRFASPSSLFGSPATISGPTAVAAWACSTKVLFKGETFVNDLKQQNERKKLGKIQANTYVEDVPVFNLMKKLLLNQLQEIDLDITTESYLFGI